MTTPPPIHSRPPAANQSKEGPKILKPLIIFPNEKTTDLGALLAIARNEARKKEHTQENPVIRDMPYVAKLGIYVAIYETTNHHENGTPNRTEK